MKKFAAIILTLAISFLPSGLTNKKIAEAEPEPQKIEDICNEAYKRARKAVINHSPKDLSFVILEKRQDIDGRDSIVGFTPEGKFQFGTNECRFNFIKMDPECAKSFRGATAQKPRENKCTVKTLNVQFIENLYVISETGTLKI